MNNLVDACMLKLRMNVTYMVKYLGFGDDFAITTSSCAFGSRWLSILLADIIVSAGVVLMIPEFFHQVQVVFSRENTRSSRVTLLASPP